jgi:hypothetical protein
MVTRLRGLLAPAVALLFLATLLAVAPAASARVVDPAQDHPVLPDSCIDEGQLVPQHAVVCHLVPFRKGRPTVVLWGDSHAWMFIPALVRAGRNRNVNLDAFVLGACPPLKVAEPAPGEHFGSKCERSNYNTLQYVLDLQRRGQRVRALLAANWVGYRQIYRESEGGTRETDYEPYAVEMSLLFHRGTPAIFRTLGAKGVDVDVVGQTLTVPRPAADCPAGEEPYVCPMPRDQAIPEEQATRDWLEARMSRLAYPGYIEVNDAVCGTWWCDGYRDGIYTFYDGLHLSATRSRTLADYFRLTVRDW